MYEKDNVLRILEETKTALRDRDVSKLHDLSNQTIHTASIQQDSDNVAVAVVIYSLGKIVERGQDKECRQFCKSISSIIDEAISSLKKNDDEKFRKSIENIRKELGKQSGKMKGYIQDVFRKAQINKASRIYEHGISMEQTAKLLGVSIWELASYTGGNPTISNAPFGRTLDVKDRIKVAMELFK